MNSIAELYNTLDKPCALLCGGITTIEDYESIKEDTYKISVNGHSDMFIDADMTIALDTCERVDIVFKEAKGITVGRARADYEIHLRDYWLKYSNIRELYHSTAIFACLLAKEMGANKVYVCGMDFYTNYPHHIDYERYPVAKKERRRSIYNKNREAWNKVNEVIPTILLSKVNESVLIDG